MQEMRITGHHFTLPVNIHGIGISRLLLGMSTKPWSSTW